jgi:aspartate ammonia-lyase
VGTGINRHPDYQARVTAILAGTSGLALVPSPTPIALHQSTHDFARYAAGMKGVALELTRIANDLRLMASGPTSGIGEIVLPAVQPGSSIMPGKVNPVMAENLNMICYHILGAEGAVAAASAAGQFQLNVMMPVIAYEILFSQGILTRGLEVFRERCVAGITADPARAARYAERTVALVTVLNPVVGYARAAEIVKRAVAEHRSILEVTAEVLDLPEASVRELLDPLRWTQPGLIEPGGLEPGKDPRPEKG